jgi:flavodoxin
MDVLVVFETMFGNTERIARAIADGLGERAHVTVVNVADAPPEVPATVDLLVVGGPTHAFSMSRESTRRGAVQRGASAGAADPGIREWLEALPSDIHPQTFAGFDTRVHVPLLPGAASHSATRLARRRGFGVTKPQSFLVEGYEGPVSPGELERARAWGEQLVTERVSV